MFQKNILSSNENIRQEISNLFSASQSPECSKTILSSKVPIYVFLRPNTFNISLDYSRPSLFFSAGTGLSPFLSYLKLRKIENKKAKILLFHGSRNQDLIVGKRSLIDSFYNDQTKDELSLFIALSRQKTDVEIDKTLENCCLTFGRVPDAMKNNIKIIENLIKSSISKNEDDNETLLPLSIYICGGKSFENDVKNMLKLICEQEQSLHEDFYKKSLLDCVKVDQW